MQASVQKRWRKVYSFLPGKSPFLLSEILVQYITLYSKDYKPWRLNRWNRRRSYHATAAFCRAHGGIVPTNFQGIRGSSYPGASVQGQWHWLGYQPRGNLCIASRPYYPMQLVQIPCSYKLSMACDMETDLRKIVRRRRQYPRGSNPYYYYYYIF